jgi:WD40 repeat protein
MVGHTRWRRSSAGPLPLPEGDVRSVAFSPDSESLAAGHGSGGVALFDATGRRWHSVRPLPLMSWTEGYVLNVAFSPDGKTLAARYQGRPDGVVLFDATSRQRLPVGPLAVTVDRYVGGMDFGPDGKTLASTSGRDGRVGAELYDIEGRLRRTLGPFTVRTRAVHHVAFNFARETLAAGCQDRDQRDIGVEFYDATGQQSLSVEPRLLSRSGKNITSMVFSSDGKNLAVGWRDWDDRGGGGVVLFKVLDGRWLLSGPLTVPEAGVNKLAFSPDGKTLAAGYRGRVSGVVLFDTTSHQRLPTGPLIVPEFGVNSLAFSPDGKTLAAGYYVGVVLFNATGRQWHSVGPLPVTVPKRCNIGRIAFSPDGKTLATEYLEPPGRNWGVAWCDVDLTSWQRLAGRIANRNLTRYEWKLYFPDTPYHATFDNLPVPPDE